MKGGRPPDYERLEDVTFSQAEKNLLLRIFIAEEGTNDIETGARNDTIVEDLITRKRKQNISIALTSSQVDPCWSSRTSDNNIEKTNRDDDTSLLKSNLMACPVKIPRMTDGSGNMVGVIKKEEELSPFAPSPSPNSAMYSPPSTLLSNEVSFCEGSSIGELAQSSPESPDQNYCSSTTAAHTSAGVDMKDDENPRRLCLVCGDIASGFHYGVASCEACKAFFKRTIQGNIEYNCPAANDCEINKRRRKACQACRFQKCLEKGMLKEGVRLDRVRGGRQKYRRNNDVPYVVSITQNKPSLEDNKLLEILLGCEPEILSVVSDNREGRPVLSPLSILSELYDKELVNVIGWAKQIPGFTDLSLTYQMRLLQSTWTEILTLSLAFRSLPPSGKLHFAVDFIFDEIVAQECGAMELYQLCLVITDRLQNSSICKEEYILLKALVLANSDVKLDEALALKQFRESIVSALMDCVAILRGNSAETASLLLCLPILRQADHTLRSFWTNVHKRGAVVMNKLFIEMLDPPLRS